MNFPSEDIFTKKVRDIRWEKYLELSKEMIPYWIFRGKSYGKKESISLKSGLERALDSYDIPFSKAKEIEEYMIRDFKRKYEGIDFDIVSEDTFYCLSLMQHYGCPTRLLDCTYSPYIAAFFAVENISFEKDAERKAFVFCFNHKWINKSAKRNIDNHNLFKKRFDEKILADKSFKPLYMEKKRSFIVADNPHQLHRRLSIQKGVFLIQGNISKSMMENIKSMKDWQSEKSVIVYNLKIDTKEDLKKVYEDLRLMNITHESLFPGLDGFAKSLKQNLYWYRDLREIKANIIPYKLGHIKERR
jgi:hypothetical protein